MALVHSRVGRVIFKHRMPKTGGLTAEMVSNGTGPVGLGYGLCWRKELNWQFMCWEYEAAEDSSKSAVIYNGLKDITNSENTRAPPTCSANLDQLTNGLKRLGPTRKKKAKKHEKYSTASQEAQNDEMHDGNANVNVSSFASVHV